jgi:hypothetical protein
MNVFAFLPDAALLTGVLKLELYPTTPGVIVNGTGGDVLSAVSGQPGWYQATVAEDLDARHRGVITLDGVAIAEALIDLSHTPPIWGAASDGLVTGFDTAAAMELSQLVQSAVAGISGAVLMPSVQTGQRLELIEGDDYLEELGRAIPWTIENAAGLPSFDTGWTLALHLLPDLGSAAIVFPGVIEVSTGANRSGFVEGDQALTSGLRSGGGIYQLIATDPEGRTMVLLKGRAQIDRRAR